MRLRSKLILILAVVTALSVIGYNLWLYSCGSCTIRSLLTPSAPGYLLLGLNLFLGIALIVLKHRQKTQQEQRICCCGNSLLQNWHYCPDCGARRG